VERLAMIEVETAKALDDEDANLEELDLERS
jgi:hypothetical protein